MEPLFQAANPGPGLYGERLAVALGFATLVFAAATFASCRACVSFITRLHLKNPMEYAWYRAFNRFHGYYWSIFLFTLALHVMSSLMHTSIPRAGDPDAGIHWLILSFGLVSLASLGVTLLSCRSWVALVGMFSQRGLLTNHSYGSFYRYHSFYWSLLILAIAGHFASSYAHVGLWPG